MSGILYIVAAPSGAGKTSLVNALLAEMPNVRLSISHTTRPPRPSEQEGEHYFFVDDRTFQGMVEQQTFLEYAQVFDKWYGTSKEWVMAQLNANVDVILEIDWQGAQQVKTLMPEVVMIFILPPSREALAQRLRQRGQDNEDIIERRLGEARMEMSHYKEYDYLIVNDDFEIAREELKTIMRAEPLRRRIQVAKKAALIAQLLYPSPM